jgi:hypothetical protein
MASVGGAHLVSFAERSHLLSREFAQALQHREFRGVLVVRQPPDQALVQQRLDRREHMAGGHAAHARRVSKCPGADEG